MTHDEVLKEFRDAGALLEGHFVLSSGLHSPQYLQCALVLQNARRSERLCKALADLVRAKIPHSFDLVVSPAMGGVVVGYEMGRQLNVPAIFTERVDGQFTLRRGFSIPKASKVLMIEDVVTTGLSSRECIAAIKTAGGDCVAAAALVDRSAGQARLGVPFVALMTLDIPVYKADELPAELRKTPAIKPGSRGLAG